MRAERRVAEAALEAARAQLARTEQERKSLPTSLQALGDGSEQAPRARRGRGQGQSGRRRRWPTAEAARVEAEDRPRGGRRTRAIAPKAARLGARGAFGGASRNMTRSPARSSMAAARRSPASGPSPAMSVRWRRRSARMPTRRSAGMPAPLARLRALPGDPALPPGRECLADHVTRARRAAAPPQAGRRRR